MKRILTSLWSLTVASTKMYFRNKAAVFFTMFIPLAFIGIFGLLSQSGNSKLTLDITNQSKTPLSRGVVDALKKIDAFKIKEVAQSEASDQLNKGKIDLQIVIPPEFGQTGADGRPRPSDLKTFYNKAKPQNGQTANLILGQVVSGLNAGISHTPQIIALKSQGVQTNNLGVIDFLLPGILAMSIMQLGIFSVAFAFVSLKTTGALRRIQATPTHPVNFVIAQAITRLIIGVIQVLLLTGLGIWFLDFHLLGNFFEFMFVALLGVIIFLAFGFTVAGWAKDENSAAPIANLFTFPMLFLSGVFFPRDGFPGWLKTITDFFPLTYVADALRAIANEGAHLTQIMPEILGMVVWGIVMFVVAVRVFRWE
ncbi:MAG: transporter permease [Patescibacteria group bacterium]|nr:transporter permease [Patescibacteria group bacterium]